MFEIVWRRIADVPDGELARAWLFTVVRRVVYRYWRGVSRFRRLMGRVAVADPPPVPEEVVVRRAELDGVLAALERLNARDRELLQLAAWEELPHAEIAESLGCSVAAVDQRLYRAKRRLAAEYAHVMNGPRLASRGHAAGGEGS